MSLWTQSARRIGLWSAVAIVLLSIAYITTGAIWLASDFGAAKARGLEPAEPFLAILETLLLLTAPALITLFAAIYAYAPPERKTCALAAFGFATGLAILTGLVHFVQLTVARRTASPVVKEALAMYDPGKRLSTMLAIDLLGWDFFLGFGLLIAAPIFKGDRLEAAVRYSMITGGLLCLAGVSGPLSGDLRFQYLAIAGYAFVFPLICLLLAILFARTDKPVG